VVELDDFLCRFVKEEVSFNLSSSGDVVKGTCPIIIETQQRRLSIGISEVDPEEISCILALD